MEDDDSDDSCDFCEFSNPSQFFNELSYHVVKCADCHEFVPLNPSFSPKICIHLSKSKCNEKLVTYFQIFCVFLTFSSLNKCKSFITFSIF